MDRTEIKSLLEALLFTSTEPLTLEHFSSVLPEESKNTIQELLAEMRQEYQSRNAGITIRELAGGYQLFSNPRWHPEIQKLLSKPLLTRLSRSALETLAIISYKQPITLPEISEIRSCNAAGAVKTLLECNFTKVLGRKRVVGRPFLYGTTREFLIHFGLKDLSEMPQLSEFEELIGEKLSPDVFQPAGPAELEIEEDPMTPPEVLQSTSDDESESRNDENPSTDASDSELHSQGSSSRNASYIRNNEETSNAPNSELHFQGSSSRNASYIRSNEETSNAPNSELHFQGSIEEEEEEEIQEPPRAEE